MKKETLKNAKHNCEACQGKGYLDETDGHDYGKVVCPVCVNDKEPKQDHFQEMNDFMIKGTLEDAADKYFPSAEKIGGETYTAYKGFMAGAKYQKENSYTEEEVLALILKFNDDKPGGFDASQWFNQNKKK